MGAEKEAPRSACCAKASLVLIFLFAVAVTSFNFYIVYTGKENFFFAVLQYYIHGPPPGAVPGASDGANAIPEIRTKLGLIRGIRETPVSTVPEVDSFIGIPFAKPPVGDLRFARPVSVEPWNSPLVANKY